MADQKTIGVIDHKNPPKPCPPGPETPFNHPAYTGARPAAIDVRNPPKPYPAAAPDKTAAAATK